LYLDYNRFLYFVVLPVIILIALWIDHGSRFFSRIIDTYLSITKENSPPTNGGNKIVSRLMPYLTRKNLYSAFVLGFLLFSFLAVPIFLTPQQGDIVSSFYQVMSEPGYEAIQWIQQQTPVGSVLVSDAYYGWWLSGFAQRPTLSAVDPQYLTLTREFEPAKIAASLLDTDYVIDNGLIQVREDGGYIGRHNPMFLAKLNWTYFPYPFFHFSNNDITVLARIGGDAKSFDLTQLAVKEMRSENSTGHAYILVKKGNNFFNYTQCTTVYSGIGFVNVSITVESNEDVHVDWVRFILQTKGELIDRGNTVGFLEEGTKVLGQLIFAEKQPKVYRSGPEFLYDLTGSPRETIQIWIGVFPVTDNPAVYQDSETKDRYIDKILAENLNLYLKKGEDLPVAGSSPDVFNYQKAINDNEISYIACRDSDVIPKFANDPAFSLVFINDDVAIFMVKRSFNQLGRQP
jgi:hypothetical protein